MAAASLDDRLSSLVGGRTASALERAFGMTRVGDLLEHYPRRYARRGELTAIGSVPLGEPVTLVAEVLEVRERPMRQRRGSLLEVKISDGHGILTLTFFNQAWRAKELVPGARGMFAGKASEYRGAVQLSHPDYELFSPDDAPAVADGATGADAWAMEPIPIYAATSTVSSWQIQKAVGVVLDALPALDDPLPGSVVAGEALLPFRDALEGVHRPLDDASWKRARATLRFHEAFLLQLGLVQARRRQQAHPARPRPLVPGGLRDRFDGALGFELTGDQTAVGDEIAGELARPHPMNRLVQGEVGSGKTLVALRAMLQVAQDGGQAALLAPTEVLAHQHLGSIARALGPDLSAELGPVLLTGSMPVAERKRALLRIVSGQARIVVGTHALLADRVSFADLGLVVVDEQHRFGVEQRDTLRAKAAMPPHLLVLTATPIPRTVAMTVFGDLDISTIRELPRGRAGISTFTVPLAERPGWEPRVWQRIAEEVAAGRQAFVVCPAIEPGQAEHGQGDDARDDTAEEHTGQGPARPPATVVQTVEELRANPATAALRIAALHGRMGSDEKDAVMRRFAAGELDVLVATTVIEVGVDVPNATVMVVRDADRFGVSQLHQLRGRIGRGRHAGVCLLVTAAEPDTLARERVDAVAATTDGFELARVDLELRREGDVLGTRQSGGRSGLRLLRVASDGELIGRARERASEVLDGDTELESHPRLAAALQRRLDESDREALTRG
ncbi:ATP-dependent DNA helicase RecG [Mycetocola reblochoni]|uniref:Probable DNA 3'-5' helicase RecG n=2 Tax=Mycetocola reblochoni TaxID=331618 RepID=A0A1R4JAX5_9MICO|nr:ATP-dependent DNA helicase RecG [Mycetocola reblochoni]RLP70016.1 ATP-dependent DNA helicase RecG [Mycetocola reblochoni]SJN29270.1 ATP-dependent DNA helicase RecG [Mycetocola reblochoni REB411]